MSNASNILILAYLEIKINENIFLKINAIHTIFN